MPETVILTGPDNAPSDHSPYSRQLGFKLVGDNIDKSVKARHMRLDGSRNQSLHCFNSFAVLDRIDFSFLPDTLLHTCFNSPDKMALAILPSKEDDEMLRQHFTTLVSHIICTHIPFFKFAFEDVVEWHIVHRYYKEMSTKSQVVRANKLDKKQKCFTCHHTCAVFAMQVPLGILNKNENK